MTWFTDCDDQVLTRWLRALQPMSNEVQVTVKTTRPVSTGKKALPEGGTGALPRAALKNVVSHGICEISSRAT